MGVRRRRLPLNFTFPACDVQSNIQIYFPMLFLSSVFFLASLPEVESNAIRFASLMQLLIQVSLFISGENVSLLVHFNFNPNVCTQFPDCGMFSAFLLSLFHLRLSFFPSFLLKFNRGIFCMHRHNARKGNRSKMRLFSLCLAEMNLAKFVGRNKVDLERELKSFDCFLGLFVTI